MKRFFANCGFSLFYGGLMTLMVLGIVLPTRGFTCPPPEAQSQLTQFSCRVENTEVFSISVFALCFLIVFICKYAEELED